MTFIILIILIVIIIPLMVLGLYETSKMADNLIVTKRSYKNFKNNFNKCNLIIIPFNIGKKQYNFLVDTGATKSVINKSFVKDMNVNKSNEKFCGVDGNYIDSESINLILKSNNKEYSENFNVLNLDRLFKNIKDDTNIDIVGILGCKFLEKNAFIIDFENKKTLYK